MRIPDLYFRKSMVLIGVFACAFPSIAMALPEDTIRTCTEQWVSKEGKESTPELVVIVAERVLSCISSRLPKDPAPRTDGGDVSVGPGIDGRDPRQDPANWSCKKLKEKQDAIARELAQLGAQIKASLDALTNTAETSASARRLESEINREWSTARSRCSSANQEVATAITQAATRLKCSKLRGPARLDCIDAASAAVPSTLYDKQNRECSAANSASQTAQYWRDQMHRLEDAMARQRSDLADLHKRHVQLSSLRLEIRLVLEERQKAGDCR